MSRNLEDEIKSLERKLAIKNAYLTVEFKFPKNSKIPEEVQNLVIAELKQSALNLSMDPEEKDKASEGIERLSDEDVKILRQVAQTIKNKSSQPEIPQTSTQAIKVAPQKERPPAPTKTFDSSIHGTRIATIVSLESIEPRYRSKVSPEERVNVISMAEDGFARIAAKSGSILRIHSDDLDFNTGE